MAVHKIKLDIKDNPEYYSLIKEFNKLMDRYNVINRSIDSLIVPRIFLFKVKENLRNIKEDCLKLQSDFIEWNKRATSFAIQPKYQIDASIDNKDLIYVHFTSNLKFAINYLNSYITLLSENYNKRHHEYQERKSFNIAITAFIIGIASFTISIFSVIHKPNNDIIFDRINKNNVQVNRKFDLLKADIDSISADIKREQDYFDDGLNKIKTDLNDQENK